MRWITYLLSSSHDMDDLEEIAKRIGIRNGFYDYEFDQKDFEIHEILGLLANYPEIIDAEIKKAPIEDIIANLYTRWKATPADPLIHPLS